MPGIILKVDKTVFQSPEEENPRDADIKIRKNPGFTSDESKIPAIDTRLTPAAKKSSQRNVKNSASLSGNPGKSEEN